MCGRPSEMNRAQPTFVPIEKGDPGRCSQTRFAMGYWGSFAPAHSVLRAFAAGKFLLTLPKQFESFGRSAFARSGATSQPFSFSALIFRNNVLVSIPSSLAAAARLHLCRR